MACGAGATQFDLTQSFPGQRIAGTTAGALTTMLPAPVLLTLDYKGQAVAHNADGPAVTIAVTGMSLETTVGGSTAASTVPFDFVQSATVYIESTRANSSLARAVIGVQATPPGKITGFNLSTNSGVNILPFLQEGAQLTSTATGSLPGHDVEFTGSITVHVTTL